MTSAAYGELGDRHFDVVAQFRLYTPDQMKRDLATFTGEDRAICLRFLRPRFMKSQSVTT